MSLPVRDFTFPTEVEPDLAVRLCMQPRADQPSARDKLSGYRAPLTLDGDDVGSTAWFQFLPDGIARPGEDVNATIVLIAPELFLGRIVVGTTFTVSEGQIGIASGEVVEVLALVRNAERSGRLKNG
jgi:hypothetical protein